MVSIFLLQAPLDRLRHIFEPFSNVGMNIEILTYIYRTIITLSRRAAICHSVAEV